MPIDTSIISRLRPAEIQQRDPYEQFAKGMQLKQLMTQQKQQDAAIADEAAQREAFKTAGGDHAKYLQALLSTGNVKAYQAAQAQEEARKKAAAELEGIGAKTAGQNATTQKTITDTQAARLAQHRDTLSFVNSPQDAVAWVNEAAKSKLYPEEIIQSALSSLQSAQTPEAFNAWKQQAALGATKYIEQNKPTYQTRNLGGVTQTLALPGLGGAPTVASTAQNTASPGEMLSAATQRRGQDMTDARSRDANAIKSNEKKATQDLTKASQIASFDTMLGTLDRLGQHPGLSRSVGVMGALPTMPGSDSANFQAELNTFQSQAFIPMVAQLKGMGALSDAEGKKLTQAVGALDTKMGEKAFRESVKRIKADMEKAYSRVAGTPRAGAEGTWDGGTTKAGANVSNW